MFMCAEPTDACRIIAEDNSYELLITVQGHMCIEMHIFTIMDQTLCSKIVPSLSICLRATLLNSTALLGIDFNL